MQLGQHALTRQMHTSITRRLQKDPVQRLSAHDALDHPWLTDIEPTPRSRPLVLDAEDSSANAASLPPVVTNFLHA